jgi:hypothetical protein
MGAANGADARLVLSSGPVELDEALVTKEKTMPQAPDYLRAKFADDSAAWDVLANNYIDLRGHISPKLGYTPVGGDMDAILYLVLEWDYAYEGPEVA